MKRNFLSRNSLPFSTCLAIMLVIVWVWVPSLGRLQEAKKRIEKLDSYPNEPIKITEITAGRRSVRLGDDFVGSDDWLKTAELTVKNTSNKDIVFVEIELNFPETKTSGDEMSFPLRLGSRPGTAIGKPPVVLKDGDESTLTLQGKRYEQLAEFLGQRHLISAITRMIVDPHIVIFADGTAWSKGRSFRMDPTNPNRYIPN